MNRKSYIYIYHKVNIDCFENEDLDSTQGYYLNGLSEKKLVIRKGRVTLDMTIFLKRKGTVILINMIYYIVKRKSQQNEEIL